jgi:hypothetical protein
VKCGNTFLLYDDDGLNGTPHLHIQITEPDEHGRCILVSVTTRRAKSDTMVCLNVGVHEFISSPSVITYAYSKVLTVRKLEEMVANGEATPKEPATEKLVARAQEGMLETDRAPREVQELFRANHIP